MPDLQPIVQRISTKYDPTGISAFLGHLGKVPILAGLAVAAIGAISGALVVCVNKTIAWGKELDSTMDLLGVTSKEAAGLSLIAKVTGTSIETLTKGLNIMGKGLVDVGGGLGTTGKELKAIGIDIYDVNGKLKSTPALLQEVADYMSKMSDGTAKTALEMKLFGRSGTEVDEILRQAANGGMQRYIDQASKMGLALSADQVSRIEQLGFNMNMLKEQFTGIAVVLGIAFIPMLQSAVTWLGNLVAGLLPAITQMGAFLGLMFGGSGSTSLVGMTGAGGAPTYSVENQWRIAHGYQPRADREASGVLPASSTSAQAPYMQGLSGDYAQHVVLTPWQEALLDLRDTVVHDFWPWFSGLDWAGTLTTLGNIAGWISENVPKASNAAITGVNMMGVMATNTINAGWDAVGWFQTNIIDPFNEAKDEPYYEKMGWDVWLTNNLITPINNFVQDTKLPTWDELILGLKLAFHHLGFGIGNAIVNFLYKLEEMYNNAIGWVNRILGVQIPTVSSHVVVPKPYAEGGILGGKWALVGEEGYELIGPDGRVYPHGETKRMLSKGLRNVQGFAGGTNDGPNPWDVGVAIGGATGGGFDPASAASALSTIGGATGNTSINPGALSAVTASKVLSAIGNATMSADQASGAAIGIQQSMKDFTMSQLSTQMTQRDMLAELRKLNEQIPALMMSLSSEFKKVMV